MKWMQVDNRHYSGRYTLIQNKPGVDGGSVSVWWSSNRLGEVKEIERAKRLCEIHEAMTLELPRDNWIIT